MRSSPVLATATMMSWLDQFRRDQTLRGFIRAPLDARERGRRVENILAVVQIQNRVTPLRGAPVSLGQINQNIAAIPENFRGKSRVALDISGQSVAHFEQEVWSEEIRVVQRPARMFRTWQGVRHRVGRGD